MDHLGHIGTLQEFFDAVKDFLVPIGDVILVLRGEERQVLHIPHALILVFCVILEVLQFQYVPVERNDVVILRTIVLVVFFKFFSQ